MFNNLINHLKKVQINYETLDENKVIRFPIRTEIGIFNCLGIVDESMDRFMLYTVLNIIIPENKRMMMCELLTRINFGLILGNFEMDMEDGEIRFKTSIDVEGSELTDKFIENMILTNLSVIDNYFHAILEFINSTLTAKNILLKYEQKSINE